MRFNFVYYYYILKNDIFSLQIAGDVKMSIVAKDYSGDLFDRTNLLIDSRAKRVPADSLTSENTPSVTATRKPPMTKLKDLFISVKTTQHYHNLRLSIIIKTWFRLAKNQVRDFFNCLKINYLFFTI